MTNSAQVFLFTSCLQLIWDAHFKSQTAPALIWTEGEALSTRYLRKYSQLGSCLTPADTAINVRCLQHRPVPADEHDGYSAVKYYSTFQEPGKKQHVSHGSAGDLAALDQVEDPQRTASAYSPLAD